MPCLDLGTSPADWVMEHPQVGRLFDELGIDYSCCGKSLGYVCFQQRLDPENVLRRLRAVVAANVPEPGASAGD